MGGRSGSQLLRLVLSLSVAGIVSGLALVGVGMVAGGSGFQPLRAVIAPFGAANYRWVVWPPGKPIPALVTATGKPLPTATAGAPGSGSAPPHSAVSPQSSSVAAGSPPANGKSPADPGDGESQGRGAAAGGQAAGGPPAGPGGASQGTGQGTTAAATARATPAATAARTPVVAITPTVGESPTPAPAIAGTTGSSCAQAGATSCGASSPGGAGAGSGNPSSGGLALTLGAPGGGSGVGSTAFFSSGVAFAPGAAAVKQLRLSNVGSLSASYALSVIDGSGVLFADQTHGLQLSIAHDGTTVYSGPLAVNNVSLNLVLAPGGASAVTLTVWLPASAGNAYQNLSTTVTFVCIATSVG